MSKVQQAIAMPGSWKQKFQDSTFRTNFQLFLSQSMVEYLCPFLKVNGERFGLCKSRLDEIFSAPAFQCHSSIDYHEDEEGNEVQGQGDNPQQCKGLMSLLAYEGQPNQIMQVAERFRVATVESHKCEGTYQTFSEAIEAHGK